MSRHLRMLTTLGALLVAISANQAGFAQKPGGVLRVHALDSPPNLSMHEEVDANPARAAMGIFNNLVMFAVSPSYVHPRLASVDLGNRDNRPFEVSVEERERQFEEQRRKAREAIDAAFRE